MSNKNTDLNRRTLLKGLATAAAAGTVAAAVSGTASANTVTDKKDVEKKVNRAKEKIEEIKQKLKMVPNE